MSAQLDFEGVLLTGLIVDSFVSNWLDTVDPKVVDVSATSDWDHSAMVEIEVGLALRRLPIELALKLRVFLLARRRILDNLLIWSTNPLQTYGMQGWYIS